MSLAEVVFWYAAFAAVLVLAMVAVALKHKARGKSIFALEEWKSLRALRPGKMFTGKIWLLLFLAAFITLCAGVIIIVFILPYGAAWAVAAMVAAVAALIALMPRMLK